MGRQGGELLARAQAEGHLLIALTEGEIAWDDARARVDWDTDDGAATVARGGVCLRAALDRPSLRAGAVGCVAPPARLPQRDRRPRRTDPRPRQGHPARRGHHPAPTRLRLARPPPRRSSHCSSPHPCRRSCLQAAQRRSRRAVERTGRAGVAILDTDPLAALRLAIQAAEISPTSDAEGALRVSACYDFPPRFTGTQGRHQRRVQPGRQARPDRQRRRYGADLGRRERPQPPHRRDRRRGRQLREFASFSPDGKLFVTAGWDATAQIWDVADGRQLRTPSSRHEFGFDNSVAAFSPDGKLVVTANMGTARIWDAASGRAGAPSSRPRERTGRLQCGVPPGRQAPRHGRRAGGAGVGCG